MRDPSTPTPDRLVCGWCGGPHKIADCPTMPRPRLSAASVLAFVAAAMVRPARAWV